MVFSFFKKPPEKMIARPPATPRAAEAPGDVDRKTGLRDSVSTAAVSQNAAKVVPVKDASPTDSYLDFVFSESSPEFQVEAEIDPVDAEAQEAAILFANAQDTAVRAVLENAVRIHPFGPGERLWLMLFDLYQLNGERAVFESLGVEYARSFEKSPPGWRATSSAPGKEKGVAAGSLLFKGELLGENSGAFSAIEQALEKNPKLRLDLSKVSLFDADGCSRLLGLMQVARKAKRELELLGRDSLASLIEAHIEPGRAECQACWLLLLELCQLQGRFEAFEDLAINFAVTFELSPPSWESSRVAAPDPLPSMLKSAGSSSLDAFALQGSIKASRFGDLPSYAEVHDPVILDCAALDRMDFISAGALLNVLTTVRRTGKQIVFRHPNRLVAELFGVVGLNAVATIVFAKS